MPGSSPIQPWTPENSPVKRGMSKRPAAPPLESQGTDASKGILQANEAGEGGREAGGKLPRGHSSQQSRLSGRDYRGESAGGASVWSRRSTPAVVRSGTSSRTPLGFATSSLQFEPEGLKSHARQPSGRRSHRPPTVPNRERPRTTTTTTTTRMRPQQAGSSSSSGVPPHPPLLPRELNQEGVTRTRSTNILLSSGPDAQSEAARSRKGGFRQQRDNAATASSGGEEETVSDSDTGGGGLQFGYPTPPSSAGTVFFRRPSTNFTPSFTPDGIGDGFAQEDAAGPSWPSSSSAHAPAPPHRRRLIKPGSAPGGPRQMPRSSSTGGDMRGAQSREEQDGGGRFEVKGGRNGSVTERGTRTSGGGGRGWSVAGGRLVPDWGAGSRPLTAQAPGVGDDFQGCGERMMMMMPGNQDAKQGARTGVEFISWGDPDLVEQKQKKEGEGGRGGLETEHRVDLSGLITSRNRGPKWSEMRKKEKQVTTSQRHWQKQQQQQDGKSHSPVYTASVGRAKQGMREVSRSQAGSVIKNGGRFAQSYRPKGVGVGRVTAAQTERMACARRTRDIVSGEREASISEAAAAADDVEAVLEVGAAVDAAIHDFEDIGNVAKKVKDAGRDVRQKEAEERQLEATIAGVEWEAHTRVEVETDEFGLEPFGTKSGTVVIGRLIGRKGMDFERMANVDVHDVIDNVKWGDVKEPTSKGGLLELREAMDEHEARLPRMLEMIRESKEFLKTLDQEDEMKLQTEGLAHAAATAEEATHYLKHFDMRWLDRAGDDEDALLKDDEDEEVDEFDFEGQERKSEKKKKEDADNKVAIHQKVLRPDDVKARADFMREVAYIRSKTGSLMRELQRKIKGLNLAKAQDRVSVFRSNTFKNVAGVSLGRRIGEDKLFVRVTVIDAENLGLIHPLKDRTVDAYVKIRLVDENDQVHDGGVQATSVQWESFKPHWGESFDFVIKPGTEHATLVLDCFAVDISGYSNMNHDMSLGTVKIPVVKEGHQVITAGINERETHNLLDADGECIRCNGGQFSGRLSLLQTSVELTRKGSNSKKAAATLVQCNVRVMLARRVLGRERLLHKRLSKQDSSHIVHQARAELFWEKYTEACHAVNVPPIRDIRDQTSGSTIVLRKSKLSLDAAKAMGGLFSYMTYQNQLKEVDLSYNELRGAGIKALVDALLETNSDANSLETLIIKGNPIARETSRDNRPYHPTENRLGSGTMGAHAIARLVSVSRNLQYLSLAECKMGDASLAVVAESLEENESVQVLDISDNNAERPGRMSKSALALGKMLAVNQGITELDMSGNGFGAADGTMIFGNVEKYHYMGLQWNLSVRRLNVAGNGFGKMASCVSAITEYLCSVDSVISVLDLSSSHISAAGAQTLSRGVGSCESLRVLVLDKNPIRRRGARAILAKKKEAKVVNDMDESSLEDSGGATSVDLRSREQVAELFDKFDEDKSNHMDEEELLRFSRLLGLDWGKEKVKESFTQMDKDGSGSIEFSEFYSWLARNLDAEQDDKTLTVSMKGCELYIQGGAEGDFDPSDPAGDYELKLEEEESHHILDTLWELSKQGKGEFFDVFMHQMDATMGYIRDVKYKIRPPEGYQTLAEPRKGVLKFKFGSLRGVPTEDDAASEFVMKAILAGLGGGEEGGTSSRERIAHLDATITAETFFKMDQASEILETLSDASLMGAQGASSEKVGFAVRVFHKLVGSESSSLLDYLTAREKGMAESMIGRAALNFQRNNATGFYRLRLGRAAEREVVLRLMEIKNSLRDWMEQVLDHFRPVWRRGGKRAEPERIWRNCTLDGRRLDYSNAWKPPYQGVLEIDFVVPKRPDSERIKAMPSDEFADFLSVMRDQSEPPEERLLLLRRQTNTCYFTCLQALCMLETFPRFYDDPAYYRVELMVMVYARIVDWRAYGLLSSHLCPEERQLLIHRIGRINLWYDEVVSPLGYWRLDLSKVEDNWITQEIVHIATLEPGANMMGTAVNGVDFEVPSSWVKEVPTNNVFTIYYAREEHVNEKVYQQGSWDCKPLLGLAPSRASFQPNYRPAHIPKDFDEREKGMNKTWLFYEKARWIMEVLSERYRSAAEAFAALDEDGGGSLSRREVVKGLFRLGIWLPPRDAVIFLAILDGDSDGSIDQAELENFWKNSPPLRYGDQQQRDYWSRRGPRSKARGLLMSDVYDMAVSMQDLRAAYPNTLLVEYGMNEPLATHRPKGDTGNLSVAPSRLQSAEMQQGPSGKPQVAVAPAEGGDSLAPVESGEGTRRSLRRGLSKKGSMKMRHKSGAGGGGEGEEASNVAVGDGGGSGGGGGGEGSGGGEGGGGGDGGGVIMLEIEPSSQGVDGGNARKPPGTQRKQETAVDGGRSLSPW